MKKFLIALLTMAAILAGTPALAGVETITGTVTGFRPHPDPTGTEILVFSSAMGEPTVTQVMLSPGSSISQWKLEQCERFAVNAAATGKLFIVGGNVTTSFDTGNPHDGSNINRVVSMNSLMACSVGTY